MDLSEHIRMDITTDNLPPNSISYASARMKSCSTGPMKSLNFPPYSKSSKEWEYATRVGTSLNFLKDLLYEARKETIDEDKLIEYTDTLVEISVFTDEFHYPVNFLPEDDVIGDSFQPFYFGVCCWPPQLPEHSEGALRGTVKCRASTTTTALITARAVEPFEVGRGMFREEDNILSNPVSGDSYKGLFANELRNKK
ncbi:hypothetical protein AVEN_125232-1 [Araneus ventricosus]|uniref:Uncharacterized protein n=1 Tax=Araneus ventricosus TaxID=182803 RepID=A0A4Y2T317_ARAVE|nr:hypothetical protein AVEN_125232-1 [Araneus ventricosus]